MYFRRIKDGVYRQKKILIACIIWSLLCICYGMKSNINIHSSPFYILSVADVLIEMQDPFLFGITLVPFMILVIMRCKMDTLNMQYVIRYRKRKKVLFHQALESIAYAAGASAFLVGTETILLSIQKFPLISWESEKGFYYAYTGTVVSEKFIMVALAIFLMYIVKFLILLAALDVLLWYPKGLPLLWVGMILLEVIETMDAEKAGFYEVFSIQYATWEPFWQCGIWMFIGVLIVILEYNIGNLLIWKKDIYQI